MRFNSLQPESLAQVSEVDTHLARCNTKNLHWKIKLQLISYRMTLAFLIFGLFRFILGLGFTSKQGARSSAVIAFDMFDQPTHLPCTCFFFFFLGGGGGGGGGGPLSLTNWSLGVGERHGWVENRGRTFIHDLLPPNFHRYSEGNLDDWPQARPENCLINDLSNCCVVSVFWHEPKVHVQFRHIKFASNT